MDSSLLLFLFVILSKIKNPNKENKDNNMDVIQSLGNFITSMEVKPSYTIEKIRILKKVGPYFPEEYIGLLNRSILYTERIVKFNELMEFMKYNNNKYITESIKVDNNKDRISKILDTVQKEAPNKFDDNLGMFMDLIINGDKYKKMLHLVTSLTKDPDNMKDPSKLVEALAPLLGDNENNKDKIKEMSKMIEIMSLLNTPTASKKE